MPSNERKNARMAKKKKKEQRTKRIIWIIIAVTVVVLVAMRVSELDFSIIKNRFAESTGKVSSTISASADIYPYNLDSSKNVKITPQNDKLNILTSVSCTVLNPTDATVSYSFNHGYANPIMSSAGSYFCLIDQGANRLRLDRLTGGVYETNTDNSVLCAAVSRNGNVVYATSSSDSKSQLVVMNSKLKKLMELDVNSGYIVSVAIDNSGKKCAYAVVNSSDAKFITTVYTVNVGDGEERASFEFEGSDILDMRYSASSLYLVFNDCVYTVTSQKKSKAVFEQGEVNTVCYNYTSDGELIYVYSEYSSANENIVVHINSSGKVKTSINVNQIPKFVSSSANEICVLFSDKVVIYSLTKGEQRAVYSCDDNLSSVNKLSSKLFVCRHQLIDILEQGDNS